MKKISFVIVIFSVSFFLTTSCLKNGDSSKKDNREVKIGLSIDTLIIERWKMDCDNFISKAKKEGAKVFVQNAANSTDAQIRQINYLIDHDVDVLVVLPKKADALSEVLQRAKDRGIKIISYDRLIRNAYVDLYVSVNSYSVGKLMAENIKSKIDSGSCFCIYGSEDDYNMTLLNRGVHDGLSGTKISCDLLFYTPDWNYDLAYRKMNEILLENLVPDAVICGNDAVAESVIRSLSEFLPGNNIPVVGQDADVLACRRIADGTQFSTVFKPVSKLAEKTVELACAIAKTGKIPESDEKSLDAINNGYKNVPVIWLEPISVTRENLQEVIIDTGFHSKSEIYK